MTENVGAYFPAEQGEFLGRILDPVRAAALAAAIDAYPYVSLPKEDPTGQMLGIAARFEAYLDPPEET